MYIPPKINQVISEFDFNLWLNRPLTKQDKDILCEELNIPSLYVYDHCKWPTLERYLNELNFQIKHTKRLINGKQTRVSIIIKEQL